MTMGDPQRIDELSFEDAIKELEAIATKLESGSAPLEESIELYGRGSDLKAHCQKILKSAEEKVEQITLNSDGTPTGTERFGESMEG